MKKIRTLSSLLRNPKILKKLSMFLIVIFILSGFLYFQKTKDRVFVENSIISAPILPVAPSMPGNLDKLYVYEGEALQKGDPIVEIGGQTIRAEDNSLVVKAQNITGSIVSSQNPPVSLIKLSNLRVSGTIDENKGLNKIKTGQPVSFTVDAFPGKTYLGFIDEVSPTAKQTQIAFSISNERPTQQFEVFAKFDSSLYPEIKNGMSAKMTVFVK